MQTINKYSYIVVKGLVLLFFLLFVNTYLSAQQPTLHIENSDKYALYPNYGNGIDYLIVLYEINPATEIRVEFPMATSLTAAWYRYLDNVFVSNQMFISPDDHTGYLLQLEGVLNGAAYQQDLKIWVIDYQLYEPQLNELSVTDPASYNACNTVMLTLNADVPELFYLDYNGVRYPINREFELSYESLEFEENDWQTTIVDQLLIIENDKIQVVDPPLKDTYFTLKGDQFAQDLGLDSFEIQSSLYHAVKVAAKIRTETEVRTETHEGDRPEESTALSGSAPLEINFEALSNEPVANYFRWEINTEGEEPFIVRTGNTHRYTFTEAGTFWVKLSASNSQCSAQDSVLIKVSESALYAPNVFTPNGDGINDEFRVAYKSIIEFNCWIYNRWGQEIYHWTDPQKGWDGTYKGKPVAEGAYFFVIRAKGSDNVEYKLRGDINLLRGKSDLMP